MIVSVNCRFDLSLVSWVKIYSLYDPFTNPNCEVCHSLSCRAPSYSVIIVDRSHAWKRNACWEQHEMKREKQWITHKMTPVCYSYVIQSDWAGFLNPKAESFDRGQCRCTSVKGRRQECRSEKPAFLKREGTITSRANPRENECKRVHVFLCAALFTPPIKHWLVQRWRALNEVHK